MEESEEESDSVEELDPLVMSRIEKISDVLQQTNQNLLMFEKLLPAYRKEEGLGREVKDVKVDGELLQLRRVNQQLSTSLSELESKNRLLEERLKSTEAKCDEFTMENMKLTLVNEDLLDKLAQLTQIMDKKTDAGDDASKESTTNETDDAVKLDAMKLDAGKCIVTVTSESEVESMDSNNDVYANYSRLKKRVKSLKDSRNKLKKKTRELLRHYRTKRNLLEKRERQLVAQKTGLLKLQDLHHSFQSSQKVLVDYLGQEFRAISKLIFLLLPEDTEPPEIEQCGDNLPLWYSQIDNLADWTKQKLIACMLSIGDSSQASGQHLLFRKLKKTTRDRTLQEETLAADLGTKQLSSISENLSICSDSQHTTIRSLIQEIEM